MRSADRGYPVPEANGGRDVEQRLDDSGVFADGASEVLKGPQGTLFGANTIGGAVNIVTAQPTGEFGGKADGTFGNYNRFDSDVAFNFPISSTLAGKMTLMAEHPWRTRQRSP